jgi:hypothetical protein
MAAFEHHIRSLADLALQQHDTQAGRQAGSLSSIGLRTTRSWRHGYDAFPPQNGAHGIVPRLGQRRSGK